MKETLMRQPAELPRLLRALSKFRRYAAPPTLHPSPAAIIPTAGIEGATITTTAEVTQVGESVLMPHSSSTAAETPVEIQAS